MPAPSPPGLKSSIEYLAMSVGIGRTLYGPPNSPRILDQRYENIEPILKGSHAAPKAPHTRLLPRARTEKGMPVRKLAPIRPCLPRPAKEPPAGPGWIHEINHDGFRINVSSMPTVAQELRRQADEFRGHRRLEGQDRPQSRHAPIALVK